MFTHRDPFVLNNLVNGQPLLRVGLQTALKEILVLRHPKNVQVCPILPLNVISPLCLTILSP